MKHTKTGSGLELITGILFLLVLIGCTSEDAAGEGSLRLQAGGGKALETGFPYTEGGVEYAFVDGWSLQFTHYVVVIGDVKLSDGDSVVGSWDGPAIIDLKKGSGSNHDIVTLEGLPATRLDLQYRFFEASEKAENRNTDEIIAEEMIENGYSYWIEGDASKDGDTVHFLLRLKTPTLYTDCINGKDQTKGIAIEANKTIGAFIYAHALHLFWDTLAAGDESLRFDAFAAVSDAEGEPETVTESELAYQDLTDLKDASDDPLRDEDGSRVFYNSGSVLPQDSLTLKTFVEYAARYGVHFNGVGLCLSEIE